MKLRKIMIICIALTGLAGCSGQTENGMTIEEVFERAQEAQGEVQSLHADVAVEQNVEMETGESGMTAAVNMGLDLTMAPFAVYQKGTAAVTAEGVGEMPMMDNEMYITEEAIYLYESMSGTWMKLPNEELADLQTLLADQSADPSEQLRTLEPFQDDMAFKETDSAYSLSLDATGEEFQSLFATELQELMAQFDMPAELQDITYHSVIYDIIIDKETFITTAADMVIDVSIDTGEGSVRLKQDMKSEFSKFNEIDKITVPQEIIDAAQEVAP